MLTRAEARAALGDMSERTFTNWVARHMPREGEGHDARYPWPRIWDWYLEQLEERGRRAAHPDSIASQKTRLALAKAEMSELDLAEHRGELMTVAEGERILIATFSRIRSQIVAWPGSLAPRLVQATLPRARSIVHDAVGELLAMLPKSAREIDRHMEAA